MPVGTVGSEYVKAVYDLDVYGTISAYDGRRDDHSRNQ